MRVLKTAIIGCGLIGKKRALALSEKFVLTSCFDINKDRSFKFANELSMEFCENVNDIFLNKDIDLVIIATLHDSLANLTMKALKAGKHVLVEKPAGKNYIELEPIINYLKNSNLKVKVGFNHRYHRALLKAKELVVNNELGDLMFIRARYGHGARLGYDKEWRSDPELSGGGELIDQGPHLIDLSRMFLGDFVDIKGHAQTLYWDMPVDDNAFMILRNQKNQTAFLQVSCTEWKNMFSFEIYGKKGKIDINGLGGSYGIEKITFYKMLSEMGPPETYSWEFLMQDNSWKVELDEFYDDIIENRDVKGNINDAYEALMIVNSIYKDSNYDYCS